MRILGDRTWRNSYLNRFAEGMLETEQDSRPSGLAGTTMSVLDGEIVCAILFDILGFGYDRNGSGGNFDRWIESANL